LRRSRLALYFEPLFRTEQPADQAFLEAGALQVAGAAQGAFPHEGHAPAGVPQPAFGQGVAFPVPPDFFAPKFSPAGRRPEGRARVAMPKTAMHENKGAAPGQDNVRPSRQRTDLEAVAETGSAQQAADRFFRPGVGRPDSAHQPAPGRPVHGVGHVREPINP